MRPLRLRMKAFISYKNETTVDFTKMTDGLFLIKGGTGAGKTTIFDGIMFALFGRSGGSERNNQTKESFHSNLAPKSEDTEVELTFLQDGKEYRVIRKIHFRKSRDGDGYTLAPVSATLYMPDGALPISANVTEKIEEIIGLNDSQFERIIMLAQGEFEKFLLADSKDKYDILQKIFDNSIYTRYADAISSTMKLLSDRRKDAMTAIENQMVNSFLMPEDLETGSKYHYGSPELLTALEELVKEDEKKIKALEEDLSKKQKAADDLNRKHAAAESNNRLLDELDEKKKRRQELLEEKEKMDALSSRYESVLLVFNKILPLLIQKEQKEKDLKETEGSIKILSSEIEKTEKEAKARKEQCEKDQTSQKEADQLKEQAASKTALLPKYDELNELLDCISIRQKKLEEDKETLKKKEAELESLSKSITEENEEIGKLQNVESERAQKENLLEQSRMKKDELTSLQTSLEAIAKEEKDLQKKSEGYMALEEAAKQEKKIYDSKYDLFISNQSAVIAGKTSEDLEKLGEVDCPVCGTHLIKGQKIHFAKAEGEIVTQDDVDEAKAAFEKAEAKRAERNKEILAQKSAVETKKEELLKSAKVLLKEEISWEDLSAQSFLSKKIEEADAQIRKLSEEAASLKKKCDRLKELSDSLRKNTEKNTKLVGEVGSLTTGIDKEEKEFSGWKKDVEKIKKGLEFGSKKEAEANILDLEKKAQVLLDLISKNKAALEETEKTLSALHASHKEKTAQQQKLQKEIEDTGNALLKLLKENKIGSEEDAKKRLDGIEDPEEWLKETNDTLIAYDNEVKNTSERIAVLTKQTEKLTRVDIDALAEELTAALESRDQAQTLLSDMKAPFENHKQTCELVKKKKADLADTEKAWVMIEKLSRIAMGSNAEGGKMNFARYVMGSHFKEVLEMANLRLDKMTGGRYQFNHKTTADYRNAQAGLDVEIYDQIEDATISKQSLSGGEKFLVSMCLALGLSDVTQNRSGGKALDTLFIDEGFGSLDDEYLDMAMNVLNSLTDNNNRLVGIISHIDTLDECIHQKICVRKGAKHQGSLVDYEGIYEK